MKVKRSLIAGVVGAIAMSVAMLILRLAGVPVSLELLLGSLVPLPNLPLQWVAGILIHVGIGACAGFGYAVLFEYAVQQSGLVVGAGLGLCHALMAGLLMSSIPAMNPLERGALISAPGPFLQNLHFGPFLFILLHILFGACVGVAYGPTIQHLHATHDATGQQRP